MRALFSDDSLNDLAQVRKFLDGVNADAAQRAVNAILDAISVLERNPYFGRPAGDLPDGYRQFSVPFGKSGYVLLYYLDLPLDSLLVLSIKHQRQEHFPRIEDIRQRAQKDAGDA